MTNKPLKGYLETALEILEKATDKKASDIARISWLLHLKGYLSGGIDICKLAETNNIKENQNL